LVSGWAIAATTHSSLDHVAGVVPRRLRSIGDDGWKDVNGEIEP